MDFYDQEVVVVSHVDLDGYCAAAIVKKKYPNARVFFSNYGRDTPNTAFIKGCKMFVTDFSISEMEMEKCRHLGIDLIWIDHHESKFREMEEKGYSFPGIRRADMSGSELTWRYLYPSIEPPRIVKYVTDYDLWQFKMPSTADLQAGLNMFELRSNYKNCHVWDVLLGDNNVAAGQLEERVIEIGHRINEYLKRRHEIICSDLTYVAELCGAKIAFANTKQANSKFFDSFDKSQVDGVCMIQYAADIGKYRTGLYSPDDMKEVLHIAKSMGGGGHPKACGFQTDRLITPPVSGDPKPLDQVISEYRWIIDNRKEQTICQYTSKNDRITLTANVFKTEIFGRKCLAINHPYISELVRAFPTVIDLMDADTGRVYQSFIGTVMTKYGKWRNGCYFTDQSAPGEAKFFDYIKRLQPDVVGCYEEDLGILGKVYWWYSNECPIGLK